MTQLDRALRALVEHEVRFVLIGAVAAVARGSAQSTRDLDICYEHSTRNLERLVAALAPFHPRLRDAPEAQSWRFDVPTLRHGMNYTLTTDLGAIDLFGEVSGVGPFSAVLTGSTEMQLFGIKCRVASLKTLIASKKAAGRPKDLVAVKELEALLELNPDQK